MHKPGSAWSSCAVKSTCTIIAITSWMRLISDLEYDRLLNELKAIEAEHPDWVTPDLPTQRVGLPPLDKFEKVRHPAPILSLANAFGADDARAWFERVKKLDERVAPAKFVVEPKDRRVIRCLALP